MSLLVLKKEYLRLQVVNVYTLFKGITFGVVRVMIMDMGNEETVPRGSACGGEPHLQSSDKAGAVGTTNEVSVVR